MKKFLIFIFTIFGLFAGMLALIVIDYEINYNKWINSRSGSQLTNPVQKYSSSSDGNKDDLESLMNMFMKGLFLQLYYIQNIQGHMKKLNLGQKSIYRCSKLK